MLSGVSGSEGDELRLRGKGEEAAQSRPTLSNLMDCSLPGSSFHGIFQARVLEWGATAFSDHHSRFHIYVLAYDIHSI